MSGQHARRKGGTTEEGGKMLAAGREILAATAAGKAGAGADEPSADGGALEPANGPGQVTPAWPGEEPGNGVQPEWSGGGRDFRTRFDAARAGVESQAQSAEELQALLDQAITLLESVSQHPALRDYSANQRKLEEIEQRLGYGAYPQ
ncbi:MAG: hypothetical protein ACLQU4_11990 [Limisphaerales bacterium]